MENHHIIPISLWWPDKFANIERMHNNHHRDILHATLDIPSRQHSQYSRKLRLITNDKLVTPPEGVALMGDIQREFFKNIWRLPKRMIMFHIEKLWLLAEQERDRYYKMFNTQFDWPVMKKDDGDKVHAILDNYIQCKQEISKEIIAFLKGEFGAW